MIYVTFDSERIVAIFSLTFNSVDIEANFSTVKTCDESWLKISEIKIMNKQLIVFNNSGISLIDLESNAELQILSAQFLPKYLAVYKDGFTFTSKHRIYFWKTSGMELFAGQATKEVSRDVRLHIPSFMKPQVSPLSLTTSHMFVIEVLVLLKS